MTLVNPLPAAYLPKFLNLTAGMNAHWSSDPAALMDMVGLKVRFILFVILVMCQLTPQVHPNFIDVRLLMIPPFSCS
jgi:hypothetical protein